MRVLLMNRRAGESIWAAVEERLRLILNAKKSSCERSGRRCKVECSLGRLFIFSKGFYKLRATIEVLSLIL